MRGSFKYVLFFCFKKKTFLKWSVSLQERLFEQFHIFGQSFSYLVIFLGPSIVANDSQDNGQNLGKSNLVKQPVQNDKFPHLQSCFIGNLVLSG